MLEFKKDDTAVALVLTLTEFVTLNDPYYLFVFTHVTTEDVVAFIKSESDDESDYPQRYNQFTIDPSVIFLNQQPGEWHYKVYQQVSSTNTDTALTGSVLEYGKMILNRATDFSYTKYDQATSYKVYNG